MSEWIEESFVCELCNRMLNINDLANITDSCSGRKMYICKDCHGELDTTVKINRPIKPRTDAVDIHKIIDDAMEKGDRSVYILIHSGGMSVTINPYVEEKVQWIVRPNRKYPVCSYCNSPNTDREYRHYCSVCGNEMQGVRYEKIDENP